MDPHKSGADLTKSGAMTMPLSGWGPSLGLPYNAPSGSETTIEAAQRPRQPSVTWTFALTFQEPSNSWYHRVSPP